MRTVHDTTSLREDLVAGVDRCVMCGLCLPHCPTYLVTRNEADSPRGRLSLMAALAQDQLRADVVLTTHLDQCLHCLRCQRACPAEVAYAGLIDGAKELLRAEKALPPPPWWLRQLLDRAALRRALARLVGLLQRSGLQKISMPAKYRAMLPQAPARVRARRRAGARGETRGTVLLFTGCVAEITDQTTLGDARLLLQAAGFDVRLPPGRTCCGALDQHGGDPRRARRCKEQNLKAFDGEAPIVSCASGCGAQWCEYGGEAARRHFDILDFLHRAEQDAGQTLAFAPLAQPETMALHTPCTQPGTAGRVSAAKGLLAGVAGLDLVDLPDRTGCCGAAGLHLLRQSDMGGRLIADKIEGLEAMGVKTLLTTNIGCAIHFRRALHARGLEVSVMHPVSLLCRQLAGAGQ